MSAMGLQPRETRRLRLRRPSGCLMISNPMVLTKYEIASLSKFIGLYNINIGGGCLRHD